MDALLPGHAVQWKKKRWIVEDIIGSDVAIVRRDTGAKLFEAPISELERSDLRSTARQLHNVESHHWQAALATYKVLRPLVEKERHRRSAADIEEAANALGIKKTRVYELLSAYRETPRLSTFLRKERSDKGVSRLCPAVQKIMLEVAETFYATPERPSPTHTWEEVKLRCLAAKPKLPAPALSTVMSFLNKQSARKMYVGRYGKKLAAEKFEPIRGSFPYATFPLAAVQIDHTPVDLVVLARDRKPMGRPTLTLVLDVCTRMIMGFYLSMADPGHMPCAMALNHAMLPKDAWFRVRGIKNKQWPIWGKPRKIFVDNAKEFRGTALLRGCEEHDIILENRPKGLPRYGGHVERAFRTFLGHIHRVPGTTFENTYKKGDYDSEGKAIMTIDEFELWFTLFITGPYHNDVHSGTGFPPINLYRKHILGDETIPGIGSPAPLPHPDRLLLDFLQPYERVVSPEGIQIDNIYYFDDVLRSWVNARDPEDPKKARKFCVVRDPRDISSVYFFDPDLKEYFAIPWRDRDEPPMSLWDLQEINKRKAADPLRKPNQKEIWDGKREMREAQANSKAETTKARKRKHRQSETERLSKTPRNINSASQEPTASPEVSSTGWKDDDEVPIFEVQD
jgi:putative transposase